MFVWNSYFSEIYLPFYGCSWPSGRRGSGKNELKSGLDLLVPFASFKGKNIPGGKIKKVDDFLDGFLLESYKWYIIW